ncbi:MAG TPA: hypothetical protein VN915_07340, partial [Elusimicrobiota bacterium]|nr:hypothetical protein [Elusimicrobiota bacterium]
PAPALAAAPAAAARADAAPASVSAPALKSAAAPAAAFGSPRRTPSSAPASAAAKPSGAEGGAAADGAALFDGKIFIVSHGRAPVETNLASLDQTLKANPELARGLNKNGAVRLVLGNRPAAELTASKEFAAKYPSALGLAEVSPVKQAWGGLVNNPFTRLVALPFKLISRAVKPAPKDAAPAPRLTLAGIAALPGRVIGEARFLARTFRDSMTKPLTSEVVGGLATKSWPLAVSLGVYWSTVGLAHPLAMAGLMALSLFQETFHGIFLNTWNNFQENLSRLRGFSYQMYFNLIYMQGFGAMYRAFSWSANPHKTIPPWSPFYWKDVLVMSLVGTFFGTLGYNGLNQLYAKGRLKRWQRSGIQQLRDVLFLLAGPFFATGSMHAFWALFVFQQALDLTIAVVAWRARTRTILYAVAEGDAAGKAPEALQAAIRAKGVAAPASTEKLTLEPAQTGSPR